MEAEQLLLFHHDPLHTDDYLDAFLGAALDRWEALGGDGARLELAAERREIEIGAVAEPSA